VADITRNAGVALAGRDLLLIGAGGAAAGVLGPLIGEQPRRIVIANRTVARAQELTQRHAALAAQAGRHAAEPARWMPLNWPMVSTWWSTPPPAAWAGAGVPVPASVLKPGRTGAGHDVRPRRAGLSGLGQGPRRAEPATALGMLVEQAAESFLIWRGVRPALADGAGRAARDRGQRAQGLKPWPETP
jgi:shikimate dehydrogenase